MRTADCLKKIVCDLAERPARQVIYGFAKAAGQPGSPPAGTKEQDRRSPL